MGMSQTTDKSDQWKLDGICSECRKKSYCGTACTARNRRRQYDLQQFTATVLNKYTGGAVKELVDEVVVKRGIADYRVD